MNKNLHSKCLYFEKDSFSVYRDINSYYAKGLGFQSAGCMLGRTDYDTGCSISKLVDLLVAEDSEIIQTQQPATFIKSLLFHNEWRPRIFITEKTPVFNEYQEVCGVQGMGVSSCQHSTR